MGELCFETFHLHRLQKCLRDRSPFPGPEDHRCGTKVPLETLPLEEPNFQIQVYESLDSTNRVLWDLLHQGAPAGTGVIALTQAAGRGQRGRAWSSPLGGLYLSIALTPHLAVQQAHQLTLSSAWGLASAFQRYQIPVQIKWLNDLVVQGRKLGGILTETRSQGETIHQAVIGIGINGWNAVPSPGINLKTLLAQQASPQISTLEDLAAIGLWGVWQGYHQWQRWSAAEQRAAYEELWIHQGQEIQVRGRSGKILGITETGCLRVGLHPPTPLASEITEVILQPGEVRLGYQKPS